MDSPSSAEYFCFKDCLAQRLISSVMSTRSTDLSPSSSDASELDDFVSYLASEIWPTLPETIRKASYETQTSIPDLETLSLDTTPTSFIDTLISYGLSPDEEGCQSFVRKVLDIYIRDVTSPPPVWSKTRTEECEMCERDGVPLTYHHLIPRSVHDKALKKKWHTEAMVNSVAWLCRCGVSPKAVRLWLKPVGTLC